MTESHYPGVTDAETPRAGDTYGEAPSYGSRSRHAADGSANGARRGYGYPQAEPAQPRPRAERRGYQPDYADPAGRAYGNGTAPAPGGPGAGYPSPGNPAPATTTYEAGGGRRGYGRPSGQRAYSSTASRVASAVRRSVSSAARGPREPRRARLQLKHIDPWSTLKFSLVLAVALFVVWMVAVGILYGVLEGMGVFDKVNGLYEDVTGKDNAQLIGPGLVLGVAALLGAINIVLFTALATIGSFIYNMCADLVGGVEVTLGEGD